MTPESVSPSELPAHTSDDKFMFVSYSHGDKLVVYPEIERLHGLGYRIWFDRGIRPTRVWTEEVSTKLRQCSLFLVFLSPQAIGLDTF